MTTALAVVVAMAVAAAVVGLPTYLAVRNSLRRNRALADALVAERWAEAKKTPPLPPYEPLPIPDPPPAADLKLTIRRLDGADQGELPRIAAETIWAASRVEQAFGGDGLDFDRAGSVEQPDRLVLRLVPRRIDWDAADRLAAVRDELNRGVEQAAERVEDGFRTGILDQIERLVDHPRLPTAAERVEVATAN